MRIRESNLEKYIGSNMDQLWEHYTRHLPMSCVCWACCEIRLILRSRPYSDRTKVSEKEFLTAVLSEDRKNYILQKLKENTKKRFGIQ